jgi:hypothetical protein
MSDIFNQMRMLLSAAGCSVRFLERKTWRDEEFIRIGESG